MPIVHRATHKPTKFTRSALPASNRGTNVRTYFLLPFHVRTRTLKAPDSVTYTNTALGIVCERQPIGAATVWWMRPQLCTKSFKHGVNTGRDEEDTSKRNGGVTGRHGWARRETCASNILLPTPGAFKGQFGDICPNGFGPLVSMPCHSVYINAVHADP